MLRPGRDLFNFIYCLDFFAFPLKALVSCTEDHDVDAFTAEVKKYDSISRLDAWHTTLLLRVKKHINSEEDLL